jgi:hypothetical protein
MQAGYFSWVGQKKFWNLSMRDKLKLPRKMIVWNVCDGVCVIFLNGNHISFILVFASLPCGVSCHCWKIFSFRILHLVYWLILSLSWFPLFWTHFYHTNYSLSLQEGFFITLVIRRQPKLSNAPFTNLIAFISYTENQLPYKKGNQPMVTIWQKNILW